MSLEICQKCKGVRTSKEGYTYIRNQPKNQSQLALSENYICNQSQLELLPVENYNYGYNYAMYKPEKHQTLPSQQDEQKWPGVI